MVQILFLWWSQTKLQRKKYVQLIQECHKLAILTEFSQQASSHGQEPQCNHLLLQVIFVTMNTH